MNKASYYSEILGPNGMYEVAIKIYHIHPPYSKALVVREKEKRKLLLAGLNMKIVIIGNYTKLFINYWEIELHLHIYI